MREVEESECGAEVSDSSPLTTVKLLYDRFRIFLYGQMLIDR